jgi:hypothetical protein
VLGGYYEIQGLTDSVFYVMAAPWTKRYAKVLDYENCISFIESVRTFMVKQNLNEQLVSVNSFIKRRMLLAGIRNLFSNSISVKFVWFGKSDLFGLFFDFIRSR